MHIAICSDVYNFSVSLFIKLCFFFPLKQNINSYCDYILTKIQFFFNNFFFRTIRKIILVKIKIINMTNAHMCVLNKCASIDIKD